jgi:hypothetical protein
MSKFLEQLRLAEKAAEDIYFAKLDRERIAVIHKSGQLEGILVQPSDSAQKRKQAKARLQ